MKSRPAAELLLAGLPWDAASLFCQTSRLDLAMKCLDLPARMSDLRPNYAPEGARITMPLNCT